MRKKKKIFLYTLYLAMLVAVSGCIGDEKDGAKDDGSYINGDTSESTKQQNEGQRKEGQQDADTDITTSNDQASETFDEMLQSFREERERMTGKKEGGFIGFGAPNEEDYGFGIGNGDYTSQFDSRELTKAYEAAEKYVVETLKIDIKTNATVYPCIDPNIYSIYDDVDRGVANGYDTNDIFICEYYANGKWEYLILAREGKGEAWNVIHHGSSYKE